MPNLAIAPLRDLRTDAAGILKRPGQDLVLMRCSHDRSRIHSENHDGRHHIIAASDCRA